MKKILIIIGSLRIGGAEKITVDLVKNMKKQNKEISLLVFDDIKEHYEESVIKDGCRVIHIKCPKPPFFQYYKDLKEINNVYGSFDSIHTCTLLNSGINILVFKLLGCKNLICHSHSTNSGRKQNIITMLYECVMKTIIRKNATVLLACGEAAGEYLYGKKLFAEKGLVIKNGVDFELFSFNEDERRKFREEFNFEDKIVIGNVARLDKIKNQEFLLEIFKIISEIKPNSRLVIVGDGPEKENLNRKIRDLDVSDKVYMLGARDDVYKILNMFDVFVLPSLYEGLPVSLIEAQVNSLPIVVSGNITCEIKLTEDVDFVGLDKTHQVWAKHILQMASIERKQKVVTEAMEKYNIRRSAAQLEEIYND